MLPHRTGIPDTWSCQVWQGELHYLANDETKLNLSLNQPLADPALKKWFSAATFYVEEAFQLPLWLSYRLGKGRWFIPAGEYPYEFQDSLTINLEVQKNEADIMMLPPSSLYGG
jgi:hypothetical protein